MPASGPNSRDGDPALPVVRGGAPRSRRGKWRAAVLLGVHGAIAAHVTHFALAGRTLSPVEPSESMYTLELGYVNAGFVFFAAALLATLVFGRFFCGWGCHIVALQDLCGWLMKKLGVKPRPFRSRLLLWVPLALALYMFVWPTVARVFFERRAFPGWSDHFVTDGFWDTFPGPVFAVLTFLVCGFAAVYFLGAKGFCTYGCPYGGFFALLDRVSPGKIVVDDRCEGCGHCTAVCTSNVLVHDEVKRFGKVVDPGCMKCMDCVSACPNGALRFGWSLPSLATRPRQEPRRTRYDLGWGEELLALGVGVVSFLAMRGLYDGPPLLMSVGLGGITAFLALRLLRMFRGGTVRVQNLSLKLGGRWTVSGAAFAAATLLWISFVGHSAVANGSRRAGAWYLEHTHAARADVLSGRFHDRWYPPEHHAAAAASFAHFRRAERWGLVDVAEVELGVAWGYLLRGEVEPAVGHIREALRLQPGNADLRKDLAFLFVSRGMLDEAAAVQEERAVRAEISPQERAAFALVLAQAGRTEQAIGVYEASIADGVDGAGVRYNLGGLLRRAGRFEEAIAQLEEAERSAPDDPDTQVELGLALREVGRFDEAIGRFERAVALAPERLESQTHLPGLIEETRARRDAAR